MAGRPVTETRSKEHHVAVGLGFLSDFKGGDIAGCVERLHPDVEWYMSPRLLETEVLRGRHDVRHHIQSLYDRFAEDLEIAPEHGRQVGDHVLLVTLIKGRNHFTGQVVQSRECWIVSVRDDLWGRVVTYPNAPAARIGFDQVTSAAAAATQRPETAATEDPLERQTSVTLATAMAEAAPTPAELANSSVDAAAPPVASGDILTLAFTLKEADALYRWLLKAPQDGGIAGDDPVVGPAFMKIRSAVEHAQAIGEVRRELEQAGIPTQHLSDQQVAQLGRRISQAAPRLGGSQT
jgi:ketosteroid isomerase-like protein